MAPVKVATQCAIALGVGVIVSWIAVSAVIVSERPTMYYHMWELRAAMNDRQPPYYSMVASEGMANRVTGSGNFTFACTSIATAAPSVSLDPTYIALPLTSECPTNDRQWLITVGICWCAWVPSVLIAYLILGLCGGNTSGGDAECFFFVFVFVIFAFVWGLCGGLLTSLALPAHPNCSIEAALGMFIAVSHSAFVAALALLAFGDGVKDAIDDGSRSRAAIGIVVILFAVGGLAAAIAIGSIKLTSSSSAEVASAPPNTCLACGIDCRIEGDTRVQAFQDFGKEKRAGMIQQAALSALDSINSHVVGCHAVHCWTAFPVEMGPALYSLVNATRLLGHGAAPSDEGTSNGSNEAESDGMDHTSEAFTDETNAQISIYFASILGGVALLSGLGIGLLLRRVPRLRKPSEAFNVAASQVRETPVVQGIVVVARSLSGRSPGQSPGHASEVPAVIGEVVVAETNV